jgi:hypothetical protein
MNGPANAYDAVVVGAGHAGIEAAMAIARLGFRTLMITQNLDTIGKLSCNPAVGGLAKGNMVREIDALGGQMGKIIDETMIQFRVLNRSRGPAVQAPRAQADKLAYQVKAKQVLESEPNLSLFSGHRGRPALPRRRGQTVPGGQLPGGRSGGWGARRRRRSCARQRPGRRAPGGSHRRASLTGPRQPPGHRSRHGGGDRRRLSPPGANSSPPGPSS